MRLCRFFRFQAEHCSVYKEFITNLAVNPGAVKAIEEMPFLPISFFKSHKVTSSPDPIEVTFASSGTTGMINSRHLVTDVSWYEESFRRAFKLFYGDIRDYCVLALLPSYLERGGSSLIYMAEDLVKHSENPDSGFYLYNHDDLYKQLRKQQQAGKSTLLIGVTFALLDFVEQYQLDFPDLIVMETRRHERPAQGGNDPPGIAPNFMQRLWGKVHSFQNTA